MIADVIAITSYPIYSVT